MGEGSRADGTQQIGKGEGKERRKWGNGLGRAESWRGEREPEGGSKE